MKSVLAFLTSRKFTPWLLLILTIVSFGLLIPFMGYFMDDWYLIWFKHTFGALQYPAYFSLDRPLMGYFYIAANALLFNSESPLVWHIFGLLTRWVCTLALWQFLNTLWPKNNKQNTWVTLLAAVFPGFLQHWIIVIYSFFYICLAGLFFSFTLMIKAIRNHKRFWVYYILSILIGFYSYAAAEFYTGLELIRPVIIWLVLIEFFPLRRQRFWQTLKLWSPYLVIYLAFMVWRAFFFESVNHAVSITSQLLASPREVLIKTAGKLIQTIVDSTISIWTQTLNLANYPGFGKTALSIILLMVIVFTSLALWLKSFNRQQDSSHDSELDSWSKQSFWLAAISLVIAIVPFWAADLDVNPRYPYDRFMLAYLLGSCLLFAGLINQLARNRTLQILFLALFAATSVGFQLNQAQDYKKLADYQRNFMWQLIWRAPNLEPGTTILSNGLPYQDYLSGNAITTEIQWTYSQKEVASTRALDYMFIFINSPQLGAIEEMSPNHAINYDFRTYQFHGSTNQVLLIGGNSSGCLRVLDENLTQIQSFTDLYPIPKRMLDAAFISNVNVIETDAVQKIPPEHLFGSEPAHTWCYYFEKAELARQKGDYAQAYELIHEANGLGFFPKDLTEWYPFIDGALRTDHFDEAAELSARIIVGDSVIKYGVCHSWQNYSGNLPGGDPDRQKAENQISLMECP